MTEERTARRGRGVPPLLLVALAAIVVLAAVAFILTGIRGDDQEQPLVAGSPEVAGEALPTFVPEGEDAAVGMPAPEVQGADFDGEPVTITADGEAKMIVFLAHWCPHCQREVPVVQDWFETQGPPEGVALYSVSTGVDPSRPNYPPDEWLEREGWGVPVIIDDAGSSVARAYGLNAFPYWVFIDADGTVAGRAAGELPPAALDQVATQLAPSGR